MHTKVKELRSQMTDPPRLRRVLLVDDYPDAREMYSEYLKFSGFDVVEASNGVEALQRAIETSPDIILMDLSLPVMDGWEATRRLKEDPRTAGIPVVALTGHALAGMFEGAKRAGCDAFVTKPCLPEDLVKEIHNVLDGGGADSRLAVGCKRQFVREIHQKRRGVFFAFRQGDWHRCAQNDLLVARERPPAANAGEIVATRSRRVC